MYSWLCIADIDRINRTSMCTKDILYLVLFRVVFERRVEAEDVTCTLSMKF